jgi:hypothetical protein
MSSSSSTSSSDNLWVGIYAGYKKTLDNVLFRSVEAVLGKVLTVSGVPR